MEPINNVLIEEIKELFFAGRQNFKGIKDNAVIFECGSPTREKGACEKGEGKITKDGKSEGHDTYNWIKSNVGRILSENNFEDVEISAEEWEKYENSFLEKSNEELQTILNNKIKSLNNGNKIYFVNNGNIIVEEEDKGTYLLLNIQKDFLKGMMSGNPFVSNLYCSKDLNETNKNLFIALFMFETFKLITQNKLEFIIDEVPEEVKNYFLKTSVFDNDLELWEQIIADGKKEKEGK